MANDVEGMKEAYNASERIRENKPDMYSDSENMSMGLFVLGSFQYADQLVEDGKIEKIL